ncbi:MAG: hypothetical protein ACI82H_001854, partial [Alphaproteobacteria bacterium]
SVSALCSVTNRFFVENSGPDLPPWPSAQEFQRVFVQA